jgi:hypothetical protein
MVFALASAAADDSDPSLSGAVASMGIERFERCRAADAVGGDPAIRGASAVLSVLEMNASGSGSDSASASGTPPVNEG